MPRVSIVTPTYNMARYLPEAIESALGQDYADKEIIVLDDGSTDETAKLMESYEDRVRYVLAEHKGVACAYNQLTGLSAGELIQVLDADDVLLPGAISRSVATLDACPTAGFVYAEATVVDENGHAYGRRAAPEWIARAKLAPSRDAFRELLAGCHITNSTVMMRRSALEEAGPYQLDSVPGEDWDMWLRIVSRHDMAYISQTGSLYRTHAGSITSSYTFERVYLSHYHTIAKLFADPDLPYSDMRKYAYACLHRTVAAVAARGRNRLGFASHLASAIRHDPAILRDPRTASVVVEGVKSVLPRQVIAAGKSVRRALLTGWSGSIG